jgi:hypothetical protein
MGSLKMTFEQFQATREHHDDLRRIPAVFSQIDGEMAAPGNTYLGSFFINELTAEWPPEVARRGKWHLLIERDEWISDDLALLERKLFEFAASSGACEAS